ncbi:hypothetical protein QCA50_020692 [Cerrena zonata]|uniref:RNA helicase n=1 Tax=Cerrena zonata TaxID=2478898 RepID=A0AAW0FGH2_9APHY
MANGKGRDVTTVKTTGVCHKPGCVYRHDVKICLPCGVVCTTESTYTAHIRGRKHRFATKSGRRIFHCSLCSRNIPEHQWGEHTSSQRHIGKATKGGISPDIAPEEAALAAHERLCAVCDRIIPKNSWKAHVEGNGHRKMSAFVAFRAAFEDAERNKHGMIVSDEDGIDFGVINPARAETGMLTVLTVKNTIPSSKIQISELRLGSQSSSGRSFFSASAESSGIRYGQDLRIKISFKQQYLGRYEDRLEIVFEDLTLNKSFVIVRPVTATVGSKEDHDALKPVTPYQPKKRGSRDPETSVVAGPPPTATKVVRWVTKLPWAEIPKNISSILIEGDPPDETARNLQLTVLPPRINTDTYARYYQTLLWVEEFRMQHDLELYDITDAFLKKHGPFYHLEVPGLAENRPSVIVGDRILVKRHGWAKGYWFEGHVHFVHLREVGLMFDGSFPGHTNNMRYHVRFKLNRLPLRRQHEALSNAFAPSRLLFPKQRDIVPSKPGVTAELRDWIYNPLIAGNPEQLQAVASIVQLPAGHAPFIVFGPPGTGKTVTIVEAIRQLIRTNPSHRIVACAPSNSAADLIACRLSELGNIQLFRLYAPSRNRKKVPDELLPFTHMTPTEGADLFAIPPIAILRRFKVIVVTCVSAPVLHGVGLPRGHFTHVFIDEAGQATETESMASIKLLSNNNTNVILSGDPMQLGPIIRSPVARILKFELSYLERLMGLAWYKEQGWRGKTVVKLLKNFRSHPEILKFPNDHFYKGELRPCGNKKVIESYISWPHLPNKRFPVIFHAVSGEDQREASSPSFFNISEVTQVKRYVEALREDKCFKITDQEIGVITPYQAQCGRIRKSLSEWDEIKVGSVEEFQGQERRVIIISTVRSSKEYIEYDLRHTLGFVASPRRFNVAVTRAQALLIIVGDPSVISLDPLWRTFLNRLFNNKAWKGDPPTWDTKAKVKLSGGYDQDVVEGTMHDMNEFTKSVTKLTLGDLIPQLEDDDDDVAANDDRPWQETE